MMIDASAFVALLTEAPESRRLAAKLAEARIRYTSGVAVLEAVARLSSLLDVDPALAEAALQRLLHEAAVTVVPITAGIARKAVAALASHGAGRDNPAQLSLAQCLSYACAQSYRVPLLFTGEAFAATDVRIA